MGSANDPLPWKRGILTGCCTRAASGHATAAPPSAVMNSRLLTRSPRRHERAASAARRGRGPLPSWRPKRMRSYTYRRLESKTACFPYAKFASKMARFAGFSATLFRGGLFVQFYMGPMSAFGAKRTSQRGREHVDETRMTQSGHERVAFAATHTLTCYSL